MLPSSTRVFSKEPQSCGKFSELQGRAFEPSLSPLRSIWNIDRSSHRASKGSCTSKTTMDKHTQVFLK